MEHRRASRQSYHKRSAAYPSSAIPVSKTSVVNFRNPSAQASTSAIAFVMIAPGPAFRQKAGRPEIMCSKSVLKNTYGTYNCPTDVKKQSVAAI